ncbi:MAG: endonuclease/exonuclease/phosphatase family protein [Flavobacteriales bacterium]
MKKVLLIAMMCAPLLLMSQVRVMSYNMLNFPTGNLQGRVDTLQKIVDYYRPHLLMIQELKNAEGLADVAAMMNTLNYGNFEHGAFVPQQSDQGSPYALQQALVYDQSIFTLKSQSEIITDVRDFNEFELYLNDANLDEGADTTFLYVYVTHLKSSTGTANQAARLAMVEDWLAYMNANRDANDNVILCGDFNIYTRNEDAYQALLSDENTIPMQDVFYDYGDWPGTNFAHKEILTQSTRANQIENDGAGGGVDDRFDFILFSPGLVNPANEIHYIEDSYFSLGNTGACYNQSITSCSANNDVPYDVLQAIYFMSDHIPQVCELELNVTIAVDELVQYGLPLQIVYGNQISARMHTSFSGKGMMHVRDLQGRLVQESQITIGVGNNEFQIETNALESGMYVLILETEQGIRTSARFLVAR